MMFEFPWAALSGGILLGVSAVLLLLGNGRVAGISGILAGLLRPQKGEFSWRLLFVIGMVLGGGIAALSGVTFPEYGEYGEPVSLIGAGLLVGFGTKLANGCTSGHGICGMGRFSKRSIVATCTFMSVAIATVFIRFHW